MLTGLLFSNPVFMPMKQIPLYPPKFYHRKQVAYLSPKVKESPVDKVSFRDQYPFLSSPECPPELKILATQKLTAYQNYTTAHARLFDCSNLQQCFDTVKQLVENYLDNQSIFEELNHYKKHNQILGKHPVFKEMQRVQELRRMNPIELVKEQERIQHNIWRIENQLKKGKQPHLRVDREKRLQIKHNQLTEINRMINAYT